LASASTHVVYLWLPNVELAVARIRERVRTGGHDVQADVVRRRFERGRENFFRLYRGAATSWRCYDASPLGGPRLIAAGGVEHTMTVLDDRTWREATKDIDHA
jgi:predicted ABC-type ATPase